MVENLLVLASSLSVINIKIKKYLFLHDQCEFVFKVPQWQPTSVFLPGESQGWGSLVGCHLWCRTESDMTEATWQQQQLCARHC